MLGAIVVTISLALIGAWAGKDVDVHGLRCRLRGVELDVWLARIVNSCWSCLFAYVSGRKPD